MEVKDLYATEWASGSLAAISGPGVSSLVIDFSDSEPAARGDFLERIANALEDAYEKGNADGQQQKSEMYREFPA
jgi:hypothetical protein